MLIVVLSDGLSGSLVSLAIRKQHPGHEFLLIDVGEARGVACCLPFCESAVPDARRWLLEPLIARRWSSFYLSLRDGADLIAGTVSLLAPEQVRAELFERLDQLQYMRTGEILEIGASHVVLKDGQRIDADYLIDAREARNYAGMGSGRIEITVRDYLLDEPHGLDVPVMLDATLTPPPYITRFMQYIPLSKKLLRVSYSRPEQEPKTECQEAKPFTSTRIRLVGENRMWLSSQGLCEKGSSSSKSEVPLPAYLDGQIVSAFKTSAWDAVERL